MSLSLPPFSALGPLTKGSLFIGAILLGLILGGASALAIISSYASGGKAPGGWQTFSGSVSVGNNPYAQAAVAFRGILMMHPDEALYYIREKDDDGEPLHEGCSYELTSGAQPTRWWSLTLYAGGETFADNTDNAHSISADSVVTDKSGNYRLMVGPDRDGYPNWISTNGAGPFMLMLRLYGPDEGAALNPPVLRRLSCEGDAG